MAWFRLVRSLFLCLLVDCVVDCLVCCAAGFVFGVCGFGLFALFVYDCCFDTGMW